MDPAISEEFIDWFAGHVSDTPWATTVSFVNPHDIAWWHRFTEQIEAEAYPPQRADGVAAELRDPGTAGREGQAAAAALAAGHGGADRSASVPFTGPEALGWWTGMMDTYLLLQSYVDVQIGRVLATLASRPEVAANTIVIFTSDHGEYAGSHGMRGKGASAYEEAMRVPLEVYDPRGVLAHAPEQPRSQLTSSADVAALMLTIASGSSSWREEREYAHLASRLDLAEICVEPAGAGTRMGAARNRRGRHRVRRRTVRRRRAPPRGVAAHGRGQAHAVLQLAPRHRRRWNPPGRNRSSTTTPAKKVAWSSPASSQRGSSLEEQLWQTLQDDAIPNELHAPLPRGCRRHAARPWRSTSTSKNARR